jgi:phosphoribosyl-AMP cyclohydrolase
VTTETISRDAFLAAVTFDANGLVPAIAQDALSGEVLMMAWMNADALRATLKTGEITYWSRSRAKLWRKGETSGHTQRLVEAYVDCDGDTLLLKVEQIGPACHTGQAVCFFRKLQP